MSSSSKTQQNITYRPWGTFECIIESLTNYQVKRLTVYSGHCISLQKHQHRSETWVTVEGTGSAIVDDKVIDLFPGKIVEIPIGAVHRLSNFSIAKNSEKQNLVVIEVQRGHYLGEDDIVRLEDAYGR